MPGLCLSQHSLIFDVPNTPELLVRNKVKSISLTDFSNDKSKPSSLFLIDTKGYAYEHYYYDYYSGDSLPIIEKSKLIEGNPKIVNYQRGRYTTNNVEMETYEVFIHYYTKSNKIIKSKHFFNVGLISHVYNDYDTTDYEKINKVEIVIAPKGDTIRRVTDFFNHVEQIHTLENKINGKWNETEKSISSFVNGELQFSSFYRNGKLVSTYNPNEKIDENPLGDDNYKDQMEHGLPVPEPYIDSFYTNEFTCDKLKSAKENKSLYKVRLHYENGKGSDLSYFRIYDRKKGLILFESDPDGNYPIEYKYTFY